MQEEENRPSEATFGRPSLIVVLLAIVITGLVFVLLPIAGELSQKAPPDLTVRSVDLITLPEPPEEIVPPEAEEDEAVMAESAPDIEKRESTVELRPLEVKSATAVPSVSVSNFGLPEFSLGQIPSAMPEIFSIGEVDQRPVPISQLPPRYPWELKRAKIEGEVTVFYVIEIDGTISNVEIESSTHKGFEKNTVDAIRKWLYKPAKKNGKIARCTIHLSIPYELR